MKQMRELGLTLWEFLAIWGGNEISGEFGGMDFLLIV